MDIPLLIEQHYEGWFESVWLVAVSKETQLKRLMERNHLSELQAQERIASQMPLDEKRAHADLVLDNNDDLAALYAQLDAALQQLERRIDFIHKRINWRKIYILPGSGAFSSEPAFL